MALYLEISGLTAGYRHRHVLTAVDLRLDAGERVLLVGPNGSGKSTLLKVIAGMLPAHQGRIVVGGHDMTCWTARDRISAGIGYLLQSGNCFGSLTVEENLELATLGMKDTAHLRERRAWIFGTFPFLAEQLGRRAGLLSGGQRQALALAMTLATRSPLLLLDEPTAGLSPVAASSILAGIRKYVEWEQTTVIMVEHRLAEALPLVTRIVGMDHGVIGLDEPNPATLLQDRTVLERLYFGSRRE